MTNVTQFPSYVNDFISQFKNIQAADLENEETIAKLIDFRARYKKHWPTVANILAGRLGAQADILSNFLTEHAREKKKLEEREKKKKALLASYPPSSHMNYRWEENEDGELYKAPRLTQEMWEELKPAFLGPDEVEWPKNIRGQLLLWDHKTNRPNLLPPSIKQNDLLNPVLKGKIIFWEEQSQGVHASSRVCRQLNPDSTKI